MMAEVPPHFIGELGGRNGRNDNLFAPGADGLESGADSRPEIRDIRVRQIAALFTVSFLLEAEAAWYEAISILCFS
jgi:hypothetical protein